MYDCTPIKTTLGRTAIKGIIISTVSVLGQPETAIIDDSDEGIYIVSVGCDAHVKWVNKIKKMFDKGEPYKVKDDYGGTITLKPMDENAEYYKKEFGCGGAPRPDEPEQTEPNTLRGMIIKYGGGFEAKGLFTAASLNEVLDAPIVDRSSDEKDRGEK